jgi:salicylate hydroxylase
METSKMQALTPRLHPQVVRKWAFPGYEPCYKGQLVYRTVVRTSEVCRIPGMAQAWCPTFWKNVSGFYVFTCPLGNDDFEVTVRMRPPVDSTQAEPASWGRRFDLNAILDKCGDFCLPVREVLRLAAAANETREFALFAGPRLPHVVANGNVVLIGDAAHPQSGNFGSGAGFALEDGYALARTLEWAWLTNRKSLGDALELLDSIRSPYYKRLYNVLDRLAAVKVAIPAGLTIDQEIEERVKAVSENTERWMYYYDIGKEVDEAIQAAGANR